MTDDAAPVVPIKPEVEIAGTTAQRLAEKLQRRFGEFAANHGEPAAFALVLMSRDGTAQPFWQTQDFDGADSPGGGGWRGFLALAGAMLTEVAVKD